MKLKINDYELVLNGDYWQLYYIRHSLFIGEVTETDYLIFDSMFKNGAGAIKLINFAETLRIAQMYIREYNYMN